MRCTRFAILMELQRLVNDAPSLHWAAILSLLTYREHVIKPECVQQKIPLFASVGALRLGRPGVTPSVFACRVLPASSTERMLQLPPGALPADDIAYFGWDK